MKILFINLPYYGHVIPTIGLVQELLKQGCEVSYLMPFEWQEHIAESGAKFFGYKNHRQLSEQMKNAYEAAEKIVEQFDKKPEITTFKVNHTTPAEMASSICT